jgi:hypothetical protein
MVQPVQRMPSAAAVRASPLVRDGLAYPNSEPPLFKNVGDLLPVAVTDFAKLLVEEVAAKDGHRPCQRISAQSPPRFDTEPLSASSERIVRSLASLVRQTFPMREFVSDEFLNLFQLADS